MPSTIPRERTIAALDEVWTSIDDVLSTLTDEQWAAPSPLPGWDVRDNVSHMVGTEAMLLGIANPDVSIDRDVASHVRNDIGEFNEVWVEHLRSKSVAEVHALFNDYAGQRRAALEAVTDEEWNTETFTPAGKDTYGRFMQIRVFDCWLHEQDIRDAVDAPGHAVGLAVSVTLDEMSTAMGFVVGKKAKVETGQSVTFALTDAGQVVRTIHVDVAERAGVVDALDGEATCTLTMPIGVMTRLCAGRVALDDVRERVSIAGDRAVSDRVLESLNYTI